MADVTMPRLSDSMEEATVVAWLVDTGDRVSSGQEIAEIETDKATVPLEAELDGAIEIVVAAGETVPLGAILAHIGEAAGAQANGESPNTGEGSAEDTAIASAASSALPSPAAASAVTEGPAAGGNGGTATLTTRVPASPVARRVAHGAGIDLATLAGTGPGGRIVRTDVEAAAAERARKVAPVAIATSGPELVPERRGPATAKGDATVVRLTRTQEVIARRMAESRATVPDFTVSTEVDVEEAWALRERLKQSSSPEQPVPSLNDFVVLACGRALREQPRVNSRYQDAQVELYARVNVGVAIAGADSLVVATVFDADRRSLGEIARTTRQLAAKVRDRSIAPAELAGATFTVSNLGMFGVDRFTAVINPPQVAILAVGAARPRAAVHDGELTIRRGMTISLSCDHRVLYGADGAAFLRRVRELLEQPLLALAA